jgi:hypothetical protein
MAKRSRGGSRQAELVPLSMRSVIEVDPMHPLIILADRLDWTELIEIAQKIRRKKLKNLAGRPPHLRAMIGAVILMATRNMTYRDAEDQIRYYAPARYLCGLTESDWSPDFTTIQDFTQLMGEEGLRTFNEYTVDLAVGEGRADPNLMVADTTAQEAAIPYPNEIGLLGQFVSVVANASKKAGGSLKGFVKKARAKIEKVKKKVRAYRLFAKTKEAKDKLLGEVVTVVAGLQGQLAKAIQKAIVWSRRLQGRAKLAHAKVAQVHETMKKLLPQIRHWLASGHVAAGKIISLHIPELYSIVRGKAGKKVEFGLKWGISRLKGGYILVTLAKNKKDMVDAKFAMDAVRQHKELFGSVPGQYAFDRGGYSQANVSDLREMGVKEVGLAPRGKANWEVRGRVKERLINERAQVEGSIGTIKSRKYGFNRPAARSVGMMGACGQRAAFGFNLSKLAKDIAQR